MFCYPVSRSWFCLVYVYKYMVGFRHFAYLRPMPLVCSHHVSEGGFNLCVVAILSDPVPWYFTCFTLHVCFKSMMHLCSWKLLCLTGFEYLLNYPFYFLCCHIYSPTCEIVVSNPFFWYSSPDFPLPEEEPEEAAGEQQCVGKWQADDVI